MNKFNQLQIKAQNRAEPIDFIEQIGLDPRPEHQADPCFISFTPLHYSISIIHYFITTAPHLGVIQKNLKPKSRFRAK
jgi:hypothetical protein